MKKYKIFTIIILFLTIILWVSFANALNDVWNQASNLAQDGFKMLQELLNVLYIIVRPFLIIAWKLLSNAFVYGSAFWIDAVLWKLWQLVRTFMNYFLWIVFIISIFVYFFKSNSKLSLSQIFPKIVIASVIINMSWFLLAVLLDLSTILLVAAWDIWNQFTWIISQWTDKKPEEDCVILPVKINTDQEKAVMQTYQDYKFCIRDKNDAIQNAPCIDFRNWVYKLDNWKPVPWCITTKDIDYSSVGMLFSIFRYMNMAFVADNTNTDKSTFWLFVIKVILMLALVIPFVLLCVILVIRIMVLWVVIPLSPILFWIPILWVFDSQVKDKLTNVIALIFQPAYVVFMLSIWFVFIQALYSMMPSVWWEENSKTILKELKIEEKGDNEVELAGILDIKSNYDKWKWTNTDMADFKNLFAYISWIIANLIAIILLWVLVFTAFKSNSFTKKISTSVDTFAKQWLKTVPFLPGGQSIASLWKAADYLQKVPSQTSSAQVIKLKEEAKKLME